MSYTSGIDSQQTTKAGTPSVARLAEEANTPGKDANKADLLSSTTARFDGTALSSAGGLVYQSLGTSDTRTAKVSSLREAIADGSYKVSSSDVADKIIRSLVE